MFCNISFLYDPAFHLFYYIIIIIIYILGMGAEFGTNFNNHPKASKSTRRTLFFKSFDSYKKKRKKEMKI